MYFNNLFCYYLIAYCSQTLLLTFKTLQLKIMVNIITLARRRMSTDATNSTSSVSSVTMINAVLAVIFEQFVVEYFAQKSFGWTVNRL